MLTPAEHDALVLQLYDHTSDDEMDAMLAPWPAAFRSAGFHTIILEQRGTVLEGAVAPVEAGAPREYEQEWRDADPRMALAVANPGHVFSDVHHIDAVAFERSDVYHAVLRPYDLRYSLFCNMPLANGYVIGQAIMRSKAAGAYDADEIAALARLRPHVRRAFDMRIALSAMRAHVADLTSALDVMPLPVFVLDPSGRILHYNAGADAVLAAGNGLAVREQRLVTAQPRTTAQLRAAVTQALAYADQASFPPRSQVRAPTIVVELPRERQNALFFVVHPIRPRLVLRSKTESRARVLVVIHDPDVRTRVDRTLLERIHGLTPTEAELAASLAEGASLADFAAARGCTEATARTHLKRVLEKTGTHRQGELVHRILASAALHAVEA